jgi:hypothetical protein
MIRFEFEAKGKRCADEGLLVIEILPPRPVAGFPDDYECPIRFSGVVSKEMRGVGVYPMQAVDLALQVAKAVARSCANEWDFFVNGQGPMTFDY